MTNSLDRSGRISVNQLARQVGVNPSTVWRWIMRGVKGVKLETYVEGGRRFTNPELHAQFIERCTAAAAGGGDSIPSPRTPAQRERDIDRAEAELAKMGV